jgi:hypothetical protein
LAAKQAACDQIAADSFERASRSRHDPSAHAIHD